MPYIGPPYDIKLITGVSGLLHWKKLCSFRTGLEAATSTIEIITARLLQCTNHRCSYGTNDNYSPIRTSRTLCDIFVIYFCVVFFVLYILVLYLKQFTFCNRFFCYLLYVWQIFGKTLKKKVFLRVGQLGLMHYFVICLWLFRKYLSVSMINCLMLFLLI